MKYKLLPTLLFLIFAAPILTAQTGVRFRDYIFSSYRLQSNIVYGTGTKNVMDVYTGSGDTETGRPLVIFIHGGGFKDGDKVTNFGTLLCGGFARKGYVAASINYRTTNPISSNKAQFEAMLRALQDAKAAVRFFRKNYAQYGIDTNKIFATGSSAGSITALHLAFLDEAEIPSYVDKTTYGGVFEGTSGNPGFSSKVYAVISNWGAIGDTAWMKNNNIPVYCVHGLADSTVFYEKVPSDDSFNYGSKYIYEAAVRLGHVNGLRVFRNTGHTLDNSSAKQDSAFNDFSKWLYDNLLEGIVSVKENGRVYPTFYKLKQNFPNPFNPATRIKYEVAETAHVDISVYDSLGRKVTQLYSDLQSPGNYELEWNGKAMPSGVYYCRMDAGRDIQVRKMVLLK